VVAWLRSWFDLRERTGGTPLVDASTRCGLPPDGGSRVWIETLGTAGGGMGQEGSAGLCPV
jgi:hypothetical protein